MKNAAEVINRLKVSSRQLKTDVTDDAPLVQEKKRWPNALQPECLRGVAGDFIRAVEPHTESDSAALLIQFLVAFGNCIDRKAHIEIEADRHYCNLYAVVVGESAKGRKGTSLGHIKRLFEHVEPDWYRDCKASGLTSGEGVASAVKDPSPIDPEEAKKPTFVLERPRDKRLLAIETEFAAILRALQREGNTLSATIRDAWDHGDLRTLTKKDPVRATGAHVSIIGHITRMELLKYLAQTEVWNGFGNRFIWIASKRSKLLPMGGRPDACLMAKIRESLHQAIGSARNRGAMALNPETIELYKHLYFQLAKEKPGLVGVMVSRAEPIILRLATIYALLDQASEVLPEHLKAAVALWEYAEQSVDYIFGGSTGNRSADKVLAALKHAPQGLTQTEICQQVFNNNIGAAKLGEALELLKGHDMIYSKKEASTGRPITRWFGSSTGHELNELRGGEETEHPFGSDLNSLNSSNSYPGERGEKGVSHVS